MSPSRRSRSWETYPKVQPRRPGPSAPRSGGRSPFGSTWWGQAWTEALEQRARLDTNRLPRGRSYARSGAVGTVSLDVGRISALVQGSRAKPYSVTVRVRVFDDDEWTKVLDAFAAEIGHTAALLDGELPSEIARDVASIGLDLLPGPGEIQPRCTCPDWADPCKHAAAVCYLVADELDRDPFGLLQLRGRSRGEVLDALRSRRARPEASANHDVAHPVDTGVRARDAWRHAAAAAPALPLPPEYPGRPSILLTDSSSDAALDVGALRSLAIDAAARALELALGGASSGLELTRDEDLARRAAALVGPNQHHVGPDLEALARRAGVAPRTLLRRALAWRAGGPAGLETLDHQWDPGRDTTAEGRRFLGGGAVARRNRVTLSDSQLRFARDGRWYPYRRSSGGTWEPDGSGELLSILADTRDDTSDE
ncbi:MAG: SWIM zinc finger family protein [Acidimicrobiales bacterium]